MVTRLPLVLSALIENGFSASEAGRSCHVPLRTAQRWAHKFQNYGECQRRYSRAPALFDKGRERSCSLSWYIELVPLCEPDKGCGQLSWQLSDGYEPFERWKYSLLESCVQRGLNRWTSCRPPSLRNRLEGFRLGKRNLQWRNIQLFRLWITGTRLSWARHHMTLAISNDVRDWDDLAYHAGAGCYVLALAC